MVQKLYSREKNKNYPILIFSRAIITYLVEKYGKNDSLYPKDVQKRAVVLQRLFFDVTTLYQRFAEAYVSIAYLGLPEFYRLPIRIHFILRLQTDPDYEIKFKKNNFLGKCFYLTESTENEIILQNLRMKYRIYFL